MGYKKYEEMDQTERELYDELYLMASNDGDFYPHDPDGSIEHSLRLYLKQKNDEILETFKDIYPQLADELGKDWE